MYLNTQLLLAIGAEEAPLCLDLHWQNEITIYLRVVLKFLEHLSPFHVLIWRLLICEMGNYLYFLGRVEGDEEGDFAEFFMPTLLYRY
jgi:hypothetical protein